MTETDLFKEYISLGKSSDCHQRVLYNTHDWFVWLRCNNVPWYHHDLSDFSTSLQGLWHMQVHFITIKVCIVRGGNTKMQYYKESISRYHSISALRNVFYRLLWHKDPQLILKGFYNIFFIWSISFFNPVCLQSPIKSWTSQYHTPSIILSDECALDSNLSSHKWFGWQVNSYLRLSLKVDQGKILTLCPIMDILWRVGWRLKIITSSSLMCRSTLYPNWRWRSLGFGWNLRSILSPLSLMMYLAPGYWLLPRRTNSCMLIIKRQKDYS